MTEVVGNRSYMSAESLFDGPFVVALDIRTAEQETLAQWRT